MINKTFSKFDRNENKFRCQLSLRSLNTSMHPKMELGEMTEDQVFMGFKITLTIKIQMKRLILKSGMNTKLQ